MGNVAAQLAARQFRIRGVLAPFAAPPSGAGDMPNGFPLQVELFVGGVWVDITHYVMTRDGTYRVSITRGQPDETSQVNPSRCAFQLNNRDGRFSPRNPLGPYYGQLGRNQPLRVSVPSGNAKSYRFWGEVPAWPQKWDKTGTDVWVELEAAGILRRLGQGKFSIGSALRATLTAGVTSNFTPATLDPVVAYWPCEDGVNSTSVASAAPGGASMSVLGTPTFSSFSKFVCSDPLPVMGSATFFGNVPAYTPTGVTALRFLLAIPSGGITDGQVFVSFSTTGTAAKWECYYASASGGGVKLRAFNSAGTLLFDVPTPGSSLNGTLRQISVEIDQDGTNLTGVLWVVDFVNGSAFGNTGSVASSLVGTIGNIRVAPNQDLTNVTMGHFLVQTIIAQFNPGDITDSLNANNGEFADDRVSRLLRTYGIARERIGTPEVTAVMGNQLDNTLLALLQECSDADGGLLYELTDNLGLGLRTLASLQNQASALALSYTAANLSEVPTPVDDDRFTRNDITVTRTGGSSARATLTSGTLSILAPPAGVGRYDDARTINIQSDGSLADQAGWHLHVGTVDEPRYPQVSINLARASFVANPLLRQQALAVRLGDRITVSGTPVWMPPDGVSQIVLGTSETIDQFQHLITFNCAPESPYRILVADDPFFGRADTDGSQLASAALATDTTLSVATTTTGPTWTTDLSQFPFDLEVGGERVTALAAGTLLSSPNAFLTTGDLTGWNAQSSTISYNTVIVNTAAGAAASILIVPDGVSASGGVRGNLTGVGTVTPGSTYIASMWAYSPGGWSDLRPAIDWYDSSGTFLSSGLGSGTSVAAGVWTFIQQTLTAPASTSQAIMRGRHGGTPASSNTWYAWGLLLVPSASVSSSSPQTMSVLRSVNGVVKPQSVGTDVRLFQPAIVAM